MPQLTVNAGTGSRQGLRLSRWTGEQFDLEFTFVDDEDDEALDVSSSTMSMTLGTIEKADGDFDKSWGDDNQAKVTITTTDTASAGTYRGQLTVELTGGRVVKSGVIKLFLMSGSSPLPIDDIRDRLRDYPELNDLRGVELLTDEELDQARRDALDDWNGGPGRHTQYSVDNFPAKWASRWKMGAVGEALYLLANNWRLNRLPTSADGLQVDAEAMAEAVEAVADKLRAQWQAWIAEQQSYETLRRSFFKLGSSGYRTGRYIP